MSCRIIPPHKLTFAQPKAMIHFKNCSSVALNLMQQDILLLCLAGLLPSTLKSEEQSIELSIIKDSHVYEVFATSPFLALHNCGQSSPSSSHLLTLSVWPVNSLQLSWLGAHVDLNPNFSIDTPVQHTDHYTKATKPVSKGERAWRVHFISREIHLGSIAESLTARLHYSSAITENFLNTALPLCLFTLLSCLYIILFYSRLTFFKQFIYHRLI